MRRRIPAPTPSTAAGRRPGSRPTSASSPPRASTIRRWRSSFAFARVEGGGKLEASTLELDAETGGYDLKIGGVALSDTLWAFGYPAAGKYKGKDLTYCKGTLVDDPYGANTWGMACNMTGGSSGGPWLADTTNPGTIAGRVASLNSYGYTGLTYMFGPKFTADTATIQADAIDGGATSGTSRVKTLTLSRPGNRRALLVARCRAIPTVERVPPELGAEVRSEVPGPARPRVWWTAAAQRRRSWSIVVPPVVIACWWSAPLSFDHATSTTVASSGSIR